MIPKIVIPPKIIFTVEGGFAVKYINKTGAPSIKGTIVSISTTTNNAIQVAIANSDMPIGVIYENGIADGSTVLVVVSGIAEVLYKDGVTPARAYWIGVSDVAGRAYNSSSAPSTTEHNREIGHAIESSASGTNILGKVNLHFN